MAPMRQRRLLWLVVVLVFVYAEPTSSSSNPNSMGEKYEMGEIQLARSRLLREAGERASGDDIRKAYRKLALRLNQNLYGKGEVLEFQLKMLNLARDALVRGDRIPGEREDESDETARADPNDGSVRQLAMGKKLSEEILGNMHAWQEQGVENKVSFDDPDSFFVGNAQAELNEELRKILADPSSKVNKRLWHTMLEQSQQLEQEAKRVIDRRMNMALHACGVKPQGRKPDPGSDPLSAIYQDDGMEDDESIARGIDDIASVHWDGRSFTCTEALGPAHIDITSPRRSRPCSPCGKQIADDAHAKARLFTFARELRSDDAADKMANDGERPPGFEENLFSAQDAHMARANDAFCVEQKAQTYKHLVHKFEEFDYQTLLGDSYPLDPCGLLGLDQFVSDKMRTYKSQKMSNDTTAAVENDRNVVLSLKGLLALQKAKLYGDFDLLADPSSGTNSQAGHDDTTAVLNETKTSRAGAGPQLAKRCRKRATGASERTESIPKTSGIDGNLGLLAALRLLEKQIWKGTAFPVLHEVVAKAIADLSETLQLHKVAASAETLETLEPLFEPPTQQRFPQLTFLASDPYLEYEKGLLREWGQEMGDNITRWNPVQLGLGYLDLVPYCDMTSQIAGCFLQAGFWFFKAMQGVGCGNDTWKEEFVHEELVMLPQDLKDIAVLHALKKAALEMLDTTTSIAEHLLNPSIRFSVWRTALRIRKSMLVEFGHKEDLPQLVGGFLKFRELQKFQPLWRPPAIMLGDLLFMDVLGSRLQEAFLAQVTKIDSILSPLTRKDLAFMQYESALLQHSPSVELARYEAMQVALKDEVYGDVHADSHLDVLLLAHIEEQLRPEFLDTYFDAAGFFTVESNPRRKSNVLHRLTGTFLEDGNTFSHIEGLEFDQQSGHLYLLGSQNSLTDEPLIDAEDVAVLLTTLDSTEPTFLTTDPIQPFHVFERVHSNLLYKNTKVEKTLKFLAYLLQQIASRTEVSALAPFEQRESRLAIGTSKVEVGEPWEVPRIWLECGTVEFSQEVTFDGRHRFVVSNDVQVQFNEGEFEPEVDQNLHSYSVSQLKDLIRRLVAVNRDGSINIPRFDSGEVVEKDQLVFTAGELIRANPSEYIEDDTAPPLKRFGRRLTHSYHHRGLKEWSLFRRFREMCKLKALSHILETQRLSLNDQYKNADANARKQVETKRQQGRSVWEDMLVETRVQLLQQELNIHEFDPGRCWDGTTQFSFRACCNGLPTAGACFDAWFSYERCCPDPARQGFSRETVAAITQQLLSMSDATNPSDQHRLANWLHAYFKDPNKDGALDRIVALLYDAEDPQKAVDKIVRAIRMRHAQFEKDHGLLRARLRHLKPTSVDKLSTVQEATQDPRGFEAAQAVRPEREAGPATGSKEEASSKSNDNAPPLTSSASLDHHEKLKELNWLPSISTPRKIFSGVMLGPIMPPKARIANGKSFERISFSQIMTTRTDFQSSHKRNLIMVELEGMAFGRPRRTGRDSASEVEGEARCQMEWTPVRPEALHSSVRPGDAVKFQSTHEVEVGFFINSVTVAPTPGGALQRLVSARLGDAIRYYEVSTDWELFVRRESPEECQRREGEEEDEEAQREKNRAWPRCMKQNLFAKGEGIFLNLALFGIQQGCFQDDCSHSDHFTTESAAVCAEVCRVVPACKFWSVTVSATTTCWLRSATIKAFVDSPRSLAADTTCHPPTLDQSSSPARAEDNAPTLFDKLRSKPLRHPRAAEALKLHGLQTLAQIQAAPDSLLRQVAIQLYELR